MKFFKKFQSYSFWVSLSAALVILVNALGKAFGFSVENEIVENVVMSIAGVLVVLGIVTKTVTTNEETDQNEQKSEDEQENFEEDCSEQEQTLNQQDDNGLDAETQVDADKTDEK